jgi:hypothetical protein
LPAPRCAAGRRQGWRILAALGTIQAYLHWEFGSVEQLDRDVTHGFLFIQPCKISFGVSLAETTSSKAFLLLL